MGGEQVRLLTVDSPQLNAYTRGDDAECGAEAAPTPLPVSCHPGPVDLAGLPGEATTTATGAPSQRFHPPPAVDATGPINVSLWLAEPRWARAPLEYRTVQTDEAVELETQAREQRRGIWATCPGGAR